METTEKIETLVKVLGTMVVEPTWIPDPNSIGNKFQGQPIQRPILQDADDRKIVENKILELVKTL